RNHWRFILRVDPATPIFHHHVIIHLPNRTKPAFGRVVFTTIVEGPYHLSLRTPILRHHDFKHEPVAARIEMRGLTMIATINIVVGTDGNIDLLLIIPVEI